MNIADMIYDLSSLWAAVKEVFPYFDRLSFDWDAHYRTYLERLLQVKQEEAFHRLLMEFMARLNDGHTLYIPPEAYRVKKSYTPPAAPSATFCDGVLTIKLNEFLKDHTPYVKEQLASAPNARLVRLDVRDNIGGNTFHAAKVAGLFISGEFESCRKWTQEHTALDAAGASQIAHYSDALLQQYLQDGLLTQASIDDAQRIMGHTKYKEYVSTHGAQEQKAIYDGPLQILISRNTVSAAEDFVAMFQSTRRGLLVGEPTAGTSGTPYFVPLRCGGRGQVVSVGYRLADGTEFIGKGIMPDREDPATP